MRDGEAVTVERNQTPVAHILPPEPVMTVAQALAGLPVAFTLEQGDAWLRDSRASFEDEVRNPWA